eukprot:3613024-Amphidinium_carterae.1
MQNGKPCDWRRSKSKVTIDASMDNETQPDLRTSTMLHRDQQKVQAVEPAGRKGIGAAHLHLPGSGLLIARLKLLQWTLLEPYGQGCFEELV